MHGKRGTNTITFIQLANKNHARKVLPRYIAKFKSAPSSEKMKKTSHIVHSEGIEKIEINSNAHEPKAKTRIMFSKTPPSNVKTPFA